DLRPVQGSALDRLLSDRGLRSRLALDLEAVLNTPAEIIRVREVRAVHRAEQQSDGVHDRGLPDIAAAQNDVEPGAGPPGQSADSAKSRDREATDRRRGRRYCDRGSPPRFSTVRIRWLEKCPVLYARGDAPGNYNKGAMMLLR